ncbi:SPOR domain-containing protein [Bordetella genomosp. 9]|uniref:Cell division protein n=1 Tax=Bordetella genomosp. 9 TaxID=1416803 RepID=A0A1W6YVA5_9BORD|nr:SPOR domain-containing protein [Bordetella genomosp. 9]ARP84829.1 cell division protein [Bordetella genomosp. 9]
MAKRRPAKRSSERGGTLYGMLTGLLIGLIVAAAVAFYVTRAPVPFVDRASRHADQNPLPDLSNAPDPNVGLYGRDGAAGNAPSGPTATPPAPVPGAQPAAPATPSGPQGPDDLGALIATLPTTPEPPPVATPRPERTEKSPEKAADKPASKTAATVASANTAAARDGAKDANGKYFLQAGAYRGVDEAEALKARILLLGLPVAVQRAEVNGKPINRVRVGPFARLDDMNRARTRLGENKIEVAVVRQ